MPSRYERYQDLKVEVAEEHDVVGKRLTGLARDADHHA